MNASSEGLALSMELLGLRILAAALGGFFLVLGAAAAGLIDPTLRGRRESRVPVLISCA